MQKDQGAAAKMKKTTPHQLVCSRIRLVSHFLSLTLTDQIHTAIRLIFTSKSILQVICEAHSVPFFHLVNFVKKTMRMCRSHYKSRVTVQLYNDVQCDNLCAPHSMLVFVGRTYQVSQKQHVESVLCLFGTTTYTH